MAGDSRRLRHQLSGLGKEHQQHLEALLAEPGPLIRGSFGTRARVCGVSGCHCAKGELHESKYLSATDGAAVRQVHVPAEDEVMVAAGVERYRRFRRTRTRLAEVAKQQLTLLEQLALALLKAYPPDAPLPPPRRRGRKPKGGGTR